MITFYNLNIFRYNLGQDYLTSCSEPNETESLAEVPRLSCLLVAQTSRHTREGFKKLFQPKKKAFQKAFNGCCEAKFQIFNVRKVPSSNRENVHLFTLKVFCIREVELELNKKILVKIAGDLQKSLNFFSLFLVVAWEITSIKNSLITIF